MNCFICNEDLENKVKVLSYFRYPEKEMGPMCQKCAKKDLENAHQIILLKNKIEELMKPK